MFPNGVSKHKSHSHNGIENNIINYPEKSHVERIDNPLNKKLKGVSSTVTAIFWIIVETIKKKSKLHFFKSVQTINFT